MSEIILKRFRGYSSCEIFLIKNRNEIFIRKVGDIERNYKRMMHLKNMGFNIPYVIRKENNILEMEYIKGMNMKYFLLKKNIDEFLFFIINFIEKNKNFEEKNYLNIYEKKLNSISFDTFNFNKDEIISKLPTKLYSSDYHGDLSLDNILYDDKNKKFFMIDCVEIEYDSWIFDLAKLRQDLQCNFFIRNESSEKYKNHLKYIQNELYKKFPIMENDYLLILMLLRIYPYSKLKNDIKTQLFLTQQINNLWK